MSDRALSIGHAYLQRAELSVQAKLPPPAARPFELARGRARSQGAGELLPALIDRGHALARTQTGDQRADRSQTRIQSRSKRCVRAERGELRQVSAQSVVDGQHAFGSGKPNVHVEPADELASREHAVLRGHPLISLAAIQ